ncbi:hypothetical protein JB92DRAFT_3100319 [Gautieria morchelliformis]|nr:hypothetical protein JB92DRAFT_3100319 [Gautieria morchelliformis]
MENQLPFLHSLGLLHREPMTLEEDRRLFSSGCRSGAGFLAPPAPLLHPELLPQPYPELPPHPLPAFQPLARPLPIPALSSPADNPASPPPFASRGDRDRRRKAKTMARLKSEEASRGGSRGPSQEQTTVYLRRRPLQGTAAGREERREE